MYYLWFFMDLTHNIDYIEKIKSHKLNQWPIIYNLQLICYNIKLLTIIVFKKELYNSNYLASLLKQSGGFFYEVRGQPV
jgi:hypothetical protein